MFRLASCFLVLIAVLIGASGCLSPPRPSKELPPRLRDSVKWEIDLVPGRESDWVLAYLLTEKFECRMTRDENKSVEQIVATLAKGRRYASGRRCNVNWRIEIVFVNDKIQTTEITPVNTPELR